jgi:cell division protein FtsA
MAKRSDRNLIVGLDIGTSKVVAIVGEIKSDGALEIIGIGSHPSRGLKKGVVVNIESTVQSIQRAVEEAELMAGCEIHSVYAGIAGSHVRSLNSHGIVAIKDKEVVQGDVERVIDAAKAVAIPADQKILHVLPQEYIIDSQEGIRDPIGMSGVRLEAKVHIVTGADSAAQNIVKCVQRCGLSVDDIVLEQLASSYAVLTEDEKDLGVCVVDIGGGTTDIAVFGGGAIRHTAVIPIAGDQVTNDIAVSMRTPTQYAEDIKIKYARCRNSPTPTKPSRYRASATGRPAGWRARLSRRSSSRATRNYSRWCATNCAVPVSRSRWPPASCSPAAVPRWKAPLNSRRKCFTCRCAWAYRNTSAVSSTWSAIRFMPRASGCCCTQKATWTSGARRGRSWRAA